jgi:hypothetical protein
MHRLADHHRHLAGFGRSARRRTSGVLAEATHAGFALRYGKIAQC